MHISPSNNRSLFSLIDRVVGFSGAPAGTLAVVEKTLSAEQQAAVDLFISWLVDFYAGRTARGFFYLCGYAGTGKSTFAEAAVRAFKQTYGGSVVGIAFTAQAAKVLKGKTPSLNDSMTAHRGLFSYDKARGRFFLDRTGPCGTAALIVADEISMLNEAYGASLMKLGVPVLVLGDPGIDGEVGQLPPIDGKCFFDGVRPDAFLRTPRRTGADSGVIALTEMVRARRLPEPGEYGDGVVVLPLTKETQKLVYRPETQAICGINRVRRTYTQRIRRQRGFEGQLPQPGERIIWKRNIAQQGLCNGMLGTVNGVGGGAGGCVDLRIDFDDLDQRVATQCHPILFQQHFRDLERPDLDRGVGFADWANVLTGHSVQGSEFGDVTVVDDSHAFGEFKFHWLYSTITRTSNNLVLLLRV